MKQTDAFPIPHRTRRTTFSLPTETLDRIELLARRFGVSQSSFVAELLDEPLAAMASIMDALPETGATPQDIKRAKGRSVGFIKDVIGQALDAVASLGTGAAHAHQRGAARARTAPTPSTRSQAGRQGESHRASATAGDSGRDRRASPKPNRGGSTGGRTSPPSRPRKTSGRKVKRGTKR